MLYQHHRDVVAFLRVRNVNNGTAARFQYSRLVVQHPVADVVVAFFGQDVGRVPRLGQAGSEPAARTFAREGPNGFRSLDDIGSLVGDLLHIFLAEAVADELPSALVRRARDRLVGMDGAAVDRQRGANVETIDHFQHSPESDAIAVFVPRPVGNVRHGRTARRRSEYGPRHGLLRIPLLDINNHPDSKARAPGQSERRSVLDRRVGETLDRQHVHLEFPF